MRSGCTFSPESSSRNGTCRSSSQPAFGSAERSEDDIDLRNQATRITSLIAVLTPSDAVRSELRHELRVRLQVREVCRHLLCHVARRKKHVVEDLLSHDTRRFVSNNPPSTDRVGACEQNDEDECQQRRYTIGGVQLRPQRVVRPEKGALHEGDHGPVMRRSQPITVRKFSIQEESSINKPAGAGSSRSKDKKDKVMQ